MAAGPPAGRASRIGDAMQDLVTTRGGPQSPGARHGSEARGAPPIAWMEAWTHVPPTRHAVA
jgi:hypothetical protein